MTAFLIFSFATPLRYAGCRWGFCKGDGWGVYPMVEFALLAQDRQTVVAEIRRVLEYVHTPDGTRYWVTQAAMAFADPSLVAGLMISLGSDDGDTRESAEYALALCQR